MARLNKADFPETVHGLLDTTKPELLRIIARKDEVEKKLGAQLNQQKTNFEALVESYNSLENENKENINKLKELQVNYDRISNNLDNILDSYNDAIRDVKIFKNIALVVLVIFLCVLVVLIA